MIVKIIKEMCVCVCVCVCRLYAPAALLLGQLPSHRANAERTRDYLGLPATPTDGDGADDYMARYFAWEVDYQEYLAAVSADDADADDAGAGKSGATLLDMVDEKERLLRARGRA